MSALWLRRLWADQRGANAVEFALLVSLFVITLLGIIDGGMWMWAQNRANKAMQVAVRHAAVTDYVAGGLEDIDFTSLPNVTSGNPVPAGAVGPYICSSAGCGDASLICNGTAGGAPIPFDAAAFASILARAQVHFPELTGANLQVCYEHVGLGYAGDPNGADIAPLVTVSVIDTDADAPLFQPMILRLFVPDGFRLTGVEATMTMEDGASDVSFSS